MKLPFRTTSPRPRPVKRSAFRRVLRGALYVKLGLVVFVAVALGLLYLRLSAAPMSFGRLPERVAEALAARIGPGWSVTLRNTAIELHDGSPALRANGLDIRAPGGNLVLQAPYAIVSVDGLSLLTANLQPKAVEIRDLQLRVLVNRDGSLTFSPLPGEGGAEAAPAAPAPPQEAAAPPDPAQAGASQVSGVVGSLFDVVVGPQSVLSSLGRAQLTNARLVFVDAGYRERARFQRLDATFDWSEDGGRRFSATVDGRQGSWRLNGDAKREGEGDKAAYRASLVTDGAPIQDILLLTGLSALPATTDLEFSGRIDAAYDQGRVTELRARLDSNAGMIQIDDKDTSPLPVDRASIEVDWLEAEKALNLQRLELKGGDTHVRLQGRLDTPSATESWRASLSGKDAVLTGAAAGDRPVRISDIAVDLSAELSGLLGASADPNGLNLDLRARKTDLRSALRIWPEAVAPPVRRFLVSNLKAGMLESIDLKVAMTGEHIAQSISGGPIPDEALKIGFAVSGGVLTAA